MARMGPRKPSRSTGSSAYSSTQMRSGFPSCIAGVMTGTILVVVALLLLAGLVVPLYPGYGKGLATAIDAGDARARSVRELALKCRVEQPHSSHVQHLALALFDALVAGGVAEMERRGLHGLVVVGIPDHIDRVLARRMLVPGVGFVLSMLLLVAWVSVLLFTPLGDVSWAVSLSGVPLAAIFVCIVWLAVVQRSAQKQDGAR